jgi:type II secretory pathway pseudopilin PulG
MLMVVSMIGLLSLFGFPKVMRIFDQSQVRSARLAVVNKYNSARIHARQNARQTFLIRSGDLVWIERFPRLIPLNGHPRDTVGGFLDLQKTYNVSASGNLDTVAFDPRGLTQRSGKMIFSRGNASDSVIVSGFGTVTR